MTASSVLRIAVAGALLAAAAPLAAQEAASGRSYRVDDSGTVVIEPFLQMQWPKANGATASRIVSASTRVSVQLNLGEWTGRSGRIYMALPRTSGPSVRATWTTGGGLLPGTLISGDRALVYAGPITAPLMRDVIDVRLEADAAQLSGSEALAFGFVIELDQ